MTSSIESAEDHLKNIKSVTGADLAHLKLDEMLEESLDRVRETMKVDTAAVLLLDPSGQTLIATAARGLEEEVRHGVRIPVSRGFAGRVAAEASPVILEQVSQDNVLNPILSKKGVASLLGVPLIVEGTVIGVVHVGTLQPRRFTDDDVDLLQVAADRIALAANSKLGEEIKLAASTLQRSLLPPVLPFISGFDLAARYVPGQGGVGGDWYDVFMLPGGGVGLVMGDVMGKGLSAAAVMGRVRTGLRAYALEETHPSVVLQRLDALLRYFEKSQMVTILYGVVPPSGDQVLLASAGHMPPILTSSDGSREVVELEVGPPIGIKPPELRETKVGLDPGSSLLLYTDGLVERKGISIDRSLEELRQVSSAGGVEEYCSRVLFSLLGDESPEDDVALLAVHRSRSS